MQKKLPTALICLSHHIGGMELAATKLAKVLSTKVNLTYIIKENTFIHKECKENADYKDLHFETINFSTTLMSPSIIFSVRAIVKKKQYQKCDFRRSFGDEITLFCIFRLRHQPNPKTLNTQVTL